MEACMMKPEVKKKPKPVKRSDPGNTTPQLPLRPTDAELSQTQYRVRRAAAAMNNEQSSRKNDQSEAAEVPNDEADFKQEKGGFFSGILKKSIKTPAEAPAQDSLSVHSELSGSSDSLSENNNNNKDQQTLHNNLSGSNDNLSENSKEKGGIFSGILRKSPKIPGEGTPGQEKGGVFSGMFKKSPKPSEGPRLDEGAESLQGELSASTDSLSENKEKGGLFSRLLRKTPKTAAEENLSTQKELSASNDSLSEAANTKEKGGAFGGIFKKSLRLAHGPPAEDIKQSEADEPGSSETLSENNNEKGGIFSGLFKKTPKPAEAAQPEEEGETQKELSASNDNLSENNTTKEKKGGLVGIFKRSASIDSLFDEEKGGLFSGLKKKTPKVSGDEAAEELLASDDSLSENSNTKEKSVFSGKFKKTPKPAEGTTTDEELNTGEEKKLFASCEILLEANTSKEKTGGLAGIFRKSPKPAPRSIATTDPLTKQLSSSCDSLPETIEDDLGELTASTDNLCEATSATKDKKGGFAGIFRRTPKTLEHQESEDVEASEGGGLRHRRTIKKKRRVVSFRVKTTLPKMPKLNLSSESSEKMPIIAESVELQDLNPAPESLVVVQPVEMAAYPTENTPLQHEEEIDELMEWWNTVKGWAEWNEVSNFQQDDEDMAIEQAADRVYMAARLFVRLFNQRGASLQHRILELLALADAADQFHKKTVQAAVGGGVASVAGSVATITGLILAPFTFGASIIVTAVGISVATAGSITSATANITDTVHSNMDRKKLEKMIQDYQEEIKDIRECMEFVQAGMDTLQEWDFEKYLESAAKKALNHSVKHVMKEGGRAGKELMINMDKLISTVQVLGAAGGAVKAAQAITITTGVMSALFLALDVVFLAKDSHELRKGAKTKFASKIRDVCKELQDGLLELNKVKTQLQKTMDGIEVEEYEEIEEVEVEVVDDNLESDPKKLEELEMELDLLEEKLKKKVKEEHKKVKEMEKENSKSKKEKEEKSVKEKGDPEEKKEQKEEKMGEKDVKTEGKKESKKVKGEEERKSESKLEKISDKEKEQKEEEEVLKDQSQKGRKKDKETENQIMAGKEKSESKRDKAKEDNVSNVKTDEKEKEKSKTVKEQEDTRSRSGDSKREERSGKMYSERTQRESERRMNKEREAESGSTRRHGSRSDRDKAPWSERGSRHGDRMESRRGAEEEERGARDWRAEMAKKREAEGGDARRESHRSHESPSLSSSSRRERRSSREESDHRRSHHRRSHHRRAPQERGDETRVGSRIERAGDEEARGSQRKHRERRGSDREHGHSWKGSRPRSNALLEDGLYI
ncbi:hypothetical protein L3Q82_021259 [Scortum barcoo]|uniref:Uncharacterized protein n=1 Tax=Scortum barcoo TaxID=214431 RepID=A0ACB8X2Y9_9TELE|nr:hypothetical protein L3Q82_021259 [Scortum barcoo]